jgi:hypothetical protein
MDLIEVLTILNTHIVIEKIGLLPEDYFLYYEEVDYCFNTIRNGFSLAVALDNVAYHKEG